MQMRRFNVKMQRIKVVFISHMHGDHYFGLIGLLNSLHLLGRTKPLLVIAPTQLEEIMRLQLDSAGKKLSYELSFQALPTSYDEKVIIYEDKQVIVHTFNLKHRLPCNAFVFEEQQRERTYLPEKGGPAGVKIEEIPRLKNGESIRRADGSFLNYEDFTLPPAPVRKFAFCTDTLPLQRTIDHTREVNVLYHEATFLASEQERSKETYHTTAKQAAEIASKAGVGKLLLGHFSARYTVLSNHLEEAKAIFENVHLAEEGKEFEIISG